MDRADLQRIVLLAVLALVVVAFGYAGVIVTPPWGSVRGLQADGAKLRVERDKLKQSVDSAQAMVANLDRIRKEREALEKDLIAYSRKLPDERESAKVLRDVETLAGKSGLTVAQVKRRPVRPQELYAEIPMEIGVSGGYQDLVNFADQLAKLERLVTLTDVTVTRPTAPPGAQASPRAAVDGAAPTLQAQVVAVVFQALPEPVPAGTPTPAKQ